MKEKNKFISDNTLIADFMGKRYDYIACDNCGRLDPELINPGKSRLTKCCSTYDKESILCFYTTQDAEGKEIYAIGKTYMPHGTSSEDLKYHSDWNELMPVVEKIEDLGHKFEITEDMVFICPNDDSKEDKPNIGWDGKSKIDAVYNGCIQFITWYNQHPK